MNIRQKFVKKICPQGTSRNLHQLTPSKNQNNKGKWGPFWQGQSRFLEVSLVQQADGELKKVF